jgi:Na+-translocating ferredoxin:NAD+ oxidoreductase subunit B
MELVQRIHQALPQTQCQRCDQPDCLSYARAIVAGEAAINQCPPGGQEGIDRLAAITGLPALPLNPDHGIEGPVTLAVIDEQWCIGCTLCIKVCPTDAIIGTNKHMHTVIEAECTGCELCIPACPVDCIDLEPIDPPLTGWAAWPQAQADRALARYTERTRRLQSEAVAHDERLAAKAEHKLRDMAAASQHTDPAVLKHKSAIVQAALDRAKARRAQQR